MDCLTCVIVWMTKKLVLHFGLKGFAERTLVSWWAGLEEFGRERQDALMPGPIKGLALFMLRIDTKVTPFRCPPPGFIAPHQHTYSTVMHTAVSSTHSINNILHCP